MNSNMIRTTQYPKVVNVSGEIFKYASIGLPMREAVDPVTANTTIMAMTCQLESIFQRSLSLFTIAI